MGEDGISTRLELAIIKMVIRKLEDSWVRSEIFDKLDYSDRIFTQNLRLINIKWYIRRSGASPQIIDLSSH